MNEQEIDARMCHWKLALNSAESTVRLAREQIAHCQALKDKFAETVQVVLLHGGEE